MDKYIEMFNDEEAQSSFDPADVQKYKVVAVLGYIFPILFFLPVLQDKNSSFCKFHSNQQLAWLIFGLIISAVTGVLGLIPILSAIISFVIAIADLLILIMLAVAASRGNAVRIPVFGSLNVF